MERKTLTLTALQCKALEPLLNKLINNYKPLNIVCFGYRSDVVSGSSCFTAELRESHHHFFLLVVTSDITRIEHDIQNCACANFDQGKVTIVAHGYETIKNAIYQGNRFFNWVCTDGMQLYSINGLRLIFDYPNLNPVTTTKDAEQHYYNRLEIAMGFLDAAGVCVSNERFSSALFLYHQVIEQSCNAMIGVCLTYRSDIHNLSRLLDFCLCFSAEPSAVFARRTPEDRRLFELLLKSYSDARYKDVFEVDEKDVVSISLQAIEFIALADRICRERVDYLKLQAEESGLAFLTIQIQ